jgi:hypothetical protein
VEGRGLPAQRPRRLLSLACLCPGRLLTSGGLLFRSFFRRGRHDRLLDDLGQLEVGLLLLLEHRRQQIDYRLLAQSFGQGNISSVGGDLIMLDPLRAGDDDQIQYGPLAVLLAD